jgi:hypothetical protein
MLTTSSKFQVKTAHHKHRNVLTAPQVNPKMVNVATLSVAHRLFMCDTE